MEKKIDTSLIEKEAFVSLTAATSQITKITNDYKQNKINYDDYITKLNHYHQANNDKCQSHYENYILEKF